MTVLEGPESAPLMNMSNAQPCVGQFTKPQPQHCIGRRDHRGVTPP